MTNTLKLITAAALVAATSTAAVAGNPTGVLNTNVTNTQGAALGGKGFGAGAGGATGAAIAGGLAGLALLGGGNGTTTTSSTSD